VLSWLFWLDGFGFFGELGWIDSIISYSITAQLDSVQSHSLMPAGKQMPG
jgi:hypothetical protein